MACLCNLESLGVRSGLALESRRFARPHCVVESLRAFDAVGLVAGGVTELVIIVGGGRAWHALSVVWLTNKLGPESDAVELVDGLCSWRKFGKSGATRESLRFFVAPIIFGGGVVPAAVTESLLLLRWLSPDPLRDSCFMDKKI